MEPRLPGCGAKQVPSPNHPVDTHEGIVHHHRKLVGKHSVGAPDNKVPAVLCQIFGTEAAVPILDGHLPVRTPYPPGGTFPRGLQRGALRRRQEKALAGVHHRAVLPVGSGGRHTFRAGTVTGINESLLLQRPECLLIVCRAAALHIRRRQPAFVPVQPQPEQVVHEPATLVSGVQPGQQRGKDVAQMHPSAGSGGKTPDSFPVHVTRPPLILLGHIIPRRGRKLNRV